MATVPKMTIQLPNNISALIHGSSDAGKTVIASCSSDLDPKELCIVEGAVLGDAEGGSISLPTRGAGIIVERYPYDPSELIDTKEKLGGFINFIRDNADRLDYAAFDSLDRFQESALIEIISKKKHERPDIQDWGDILMLIQKFCRSLPTWGVNAIVTCHTTEAVDDDDRIKRLMPALQGSIQSKLASYFDILVYYEFDSDTGDRILHTKKTRKWAARSRLGSCLPDELKNPTIPGIIAEYRERREAFIEKLKGNSRVQVVDENKNVLT